MSKQCALWWMVILSLSTLTSVQANSDCNYVLDQSGARISSINFPTVYPDHHKCTWKMTVNSGDRVSLRFSHFETENCCDDVSIYDGTSTSARLIGEYSGNTLPPVMISSGNSMYIVFMTDGSVVSTGFTGILGTNGYDLVLDESTGILRSPEYPQPFPEGYYFTWTITVDLGYFISLEFVNLTTMSSSDIVEVYDGNSIYASLLGHLNRYTHSSVVASTGNQMFIVFGALQSVRSSFVGNYNSREIDECLAKGNQECDQICIDRFGTFDCSCHEGFKISDVDWRKCQDCDEWTYGMECSRICQCEFNTTDYCNKTDGSCVCKDGWTGLQCSVIIQAPSASPKIEPIYDEKNYWIIIGIMGLLLAVAFFLILVLVLKLRKKMNKSKLIVETNPLPPVETRPLDEIIRNATSEAQNSPITNRSSRVYEGVDDEYEVPISPPVATKPQIAEKKSAAVPNRYGKFPKAGPKPPQGAAGGDSCSHKNVGDDYEVMASSPAEPRPVAVTSKSEKSSQPGSTSHQDTTDRESGIYVNILPTIPARDKAGASDPEGIYLNTK